MKNIHFIAAMKIIVFIILVETPYVFASSIFTEYVVTINNDDGVQYSQLISIENDRISMPYISKQYSGRLGQEKILDWAIYFLVNNKDDFTISMSSRTCGSLSYEGAIGYRQDILTSNGCSASISVVGK
jgi:hypothetical protein